MTSFPKHIAEKMLKDSSQWEYVEPSPFPPGFADQPEKPEVLTRHLKDTDDDHDQASHAGGGGGTSDRKAKIQAWADKRFKNPEHAKAFVEWFGDSKAVDENGNPLITFHGTVEQFTAFKKSKGGRNTEAHSGELGFFFTDDPETAADYTEIGDGREATRLKERYEVYERKAQRSGKKQDWRRYEDAYVEYENYVMALDYTQGVEGASVMPTYLKMDNPLVRDFGGKEYREESYAKLMKKAKSSGHDGVVFNNTIDPGNPNNARPITVYAVFDSTQIKSATGNAGTFDPNNPRIDRSLKSDETTRAVSATVLKLWGWLQSLAAVNDLLMPDIEELPDLPELPKPAPDLEALTEVPPVPEKKYYPPQAPFDESGEEVKKYKADMLTFPYALYTAIPDDKADANHVALATLGLDGTGVYRADDPMWYHFTPPWRFACRCKKTMLTLQEAAELGVREAQTWLETETPPENPEYRFASIPFRADAGYLLGNPKLMPQSMRHLKDTDDDHDQGSHGGGGKNSAKKLRPVIAIADPQKNFDWVYFTAELGETHGEAYAKAKKERPDLFNSEGEPNNWNDVDFNLFQEADGTYIDRLTAWSKYDVSAAEQVNKLTKRELVRAWNQKARHLKGTPDDHDQSSHGGGGKYEEVKEKFGKAVADEFAKTGNLPPFEFDSDKDISQLKVALERSRKAIEKSMQTEAALAELTNDPSRQVTVAAFNQMDNRDKAVLGFYTRGGYQRINNDMRGDHPSQATKLMVNRLDSVLEKTPEHSGDVYRVVGSTVREQITRDGAIFSDKTYSSTTTATRTLSKFADEPTDVVIRYSGNHGGRRIPSVFMSEQEVLLPRNVRFRVVSVTESVKEFNGLTVVTVERE